MDSGQIDFYQHDSVCSNTCRSTKFDVLINSTRPPPGNAVQPSLSSLALDPVGGQVPPLTGRFQLAFTVYCPPHMLPQLLLYYLDDKLEDRAKAKKKGAKRKIIQIEIS